MSKLRKLSARKRRVPILVVSLAFVFGLQTAAEPAVLGDNYPSNLKYAPSGSVDPWGFYVRNCTSFVAWRLNSANGVDFSNRMSGGHWGNASNWDDNARTLGYRVDNSPAVGAVAHNPSGNHVAWVAEVHGDGTVTIEEYNWMSSGAYNVRRVSASKYQYIHVKDVSNSSGADNTHQWYGWESLGSPSGGLNSGLSVASWGSNRLDVFARGINGDLIHKSWDGAWSGWESLGGSLASDPSAVSWGPNRIDVFARGVNGDLIHKWYEGGWSRWESLGSPAGGLTSAPGVSSWAAGRLDIFARGTSGDLIHKWFDNGWRGWESLGGQLGSDPAAISWGANRIDVFARGVNGDLIHKWFDNGWRGWESLGSSLTSRPAVSSWSSGRLDIFARGANGDLIHRWFSNGWHGWESLGGTFLNGPGAVSWGTNRIDVFVQSPNNQLLQRRFA